MNRGVRLAACLCAAVALAPAVPAHATDTAAQAARLKVSPARPALQPVRPLGSFTPSFGDLSAAVPRAGAPVDARQFRFTPSGDGRSLSLGVDSRVLAAPSATRGSDEPAGYEAGMALGVRGVALTGRVARLDAGLQQRQSVAVGLSYGRRDWQTMLRLGAEHSGPPGPAALLDQRNYSVEVGGSVNVRRNVAVGANLRYRLPEDPAQRQRDAQDGAALVGAKVAF
jgi:hypothetical protein